MTHDEHHPVPPKWKPHLDWRTWAVVLMLIGMLVYIFTMDESLNPATPGAPQQPMPAAAE